MDTFMNKKGKLTVSLGSGYISQYELGNLKIGMVVKVDKNSGKPFNTYFNHHFICQGEIVLLTHHLGFRVTGFNHTETPSMLPGVVDDIVEILPTAIILDEIDVSIDELNHVTIGTIIGLEKEYGAEVELRVAGIPVALGNLVIIEEKIGIQIKKLSFHNIPTTRQIRSSGYVIDQDSTPIEGYNFKRPPCFSHASIIKIQRIHELFLKNLALGLPETSSLSEIKVERWAFGELLEGIKKDYHFMILKNDLRPDSGACNREVLSLNQGAKFKYFIKQEDSKNPTQALELEKIIQSIDSSRNAKEKQFLVAYPSDGILKKLTTEKTITELLVNPLRNGWKNFVSLNFQYIKSADDANEVKIVHEMELIIAVKISSEQKTNELIIIYPYISMKPILPILEEL